MHSSSKIWVAGSRGMVGSAIKRRLEQHGYTRIFAPTRQEVNLTRQMEVEGFFAREKPEYVILAAAKVGGIHANDTYPAEFIYSNLAIQNNVIHSAYKHKVKKLLFLGSSCIYPKDAPQPMLEEHLLSGPLEPTNEPYAVAKIAGIKMCQSYRRQYGCNFIACQPTNLYGPNDNYDRMNAHVMPALIRKFHEAAENRQESYTVWGSGKAKREFLYVDDLAEACILLMKEYNDLDIVNIGSSEEISIAELAALIAKTVGFHGRLEFDLSKPDGPLRKWVDSSKIRALGWKPKIRLAEGIQAAYADFLGGKVRLGNNKSLSQ